MPDVDAWTALARSSPWRWRTLRLTCRWDGPHAPPPVRAWVRRPGALRVEDLDGRLLLADDGPRQGAGADRPVDRSVLPEPVLRPDGLVARRPSHDAIGDDPMWQTYRWVAMLDPVELTDGEGRWTDDPTPDPVRVEQVREVDHHGRPAWEALVHPTEDYDPRCSCCPLLHCAVSDAHEVSAGARPAGRTWPDAHRVRLDVGTGVCVRTEEVGGDAPGLRHEVVLEAVDLELSDALFRGR